MNAYLAYCIGIGAVFSFVPQVLKDTITTCVLHGNLPINVAWRYPHK